MNLLELKQVTKKFGKGHTEVTALKKTDFAIKAGEFVAIIGPSGSGKSTLLTIAGGLQSPTEGEVFINGKNFSNVKEKQRSALRFKELGFILQASNLIPFLSVNDQLKLVNKVEKKPFDQKATDKLLEDLGVLSLKNSYPKDLSGGERQRVAIARALYHHPSVILADEPTASLDSEKAFEVVEILAKETKEKQKATIMVTHDQRLIERCDKVYEMRDGILKLL
ncbi:ABC transporter ATP-binding protein [Carnobacterium maltaromaticum]|uniref:ABC transporter ATP-binding protein n=1 Tax=Carnobacterium maltaromaticum TaxID=2751 RepID=UPI0007052D1C|nr:ABC transporter ATP-binding protein [Carnobacterium maltaromaticum]KRN86498.1 ABC exporter, ATP-binding subunit [Carnobacterium maltaromaticum]MDT1945178.1 ABC transporter ATP-binding protein [Carnobacterium maltaromaticum]MDT1999549.1 ABC transporter ATP-binding protein [Carnobacterium maltaromaticum]MDW5525134.1 ABC transporter ATP-binding protein [Carnobacterium maltaromaticum]TFJ32173.1 ABC transporter ATP-binding protein [Carnobacterium maltaromaticum]